jgi:tRNA(adenine34) deaminase
MTDEFFLKHAIKISKVAREAGEYPFGAVLVLENQIVFEAIDRCLGLTDPTAHAERLAISKYCRLNNTLDLENFTLYSSTEPCVMCAGAIKWAQISKVVFSVSQSLLQGLNGGRPKPTCESIVNTGGRKIEVVGGLLEIEGLEVFEGFDFKPKRDHPNAQYRLHTMFTGFRKCLDVVNDGKNNKLSLEDCGSYSGQSWSVNVQP